MKRVTSFQGAWLSCCRLAISPLWQSAISILGRICAPGSTSCVERKETTLEPSYGRS